MYVSILCDIEPNQGQNRAKSENRHDNHLVFSSAYDFFCVLDAFSYCQCHATPVYLFRVRVTGSDSHVPGPCLGTIGSGGFRFVSGIRRFHPHETHKGARK